MHTLADFALTTNLQILLAAGIRPTTPPTNDYDFAVACPDCEVSAKMTGDRIRCENADCNFGSSRVVDFLAARIGGYQEVTKFIAAHFPQAPRTQMWSEIGNFLREAMARRWVRDMAVRGPKAQGVEAARLLGTLHRQGYSRLESSGKFYTVDSQLLTTLRNLKLDVPNDPCLAIPLWSASAEFGGLVFLTMPLKVLKFGDDVLLTGWRPAKSGDLDFKGSLEAAEKALRDSRSVVPPAFVFPGGKSVPAAFNIRRPVETSLVDLGVLLRHLPTLKIENRPASDWMVDAVQNGCKPEMSAPVRRLLESCPPDTALQYRMEQALLSSGKLHAATSLRALAQSRELFQQGQGAVQVSPSGYVLSGTEELRLTNFSLALQGNLVFDDLSDVWHSGTLEVAGVRGLVTIGSGDLANATKLENALRGQAPQGSALPTIFEPSKVGKILLPWWRRQVAELPQSIGVSSLGWAPDRKRFQGAGWCVTDGVLQQERVIYRPDVAVLRSFDHAAAVTDPQLLGDLPEAARDLVAMVAATLCRIYVRSKVTGVTIQNSNPARGLCSAVFRALGQLSAFEMSSNLRHHTFISGISGHPLLAVGYNPMQAESCRLPCFFLTEKGYNVVEADYSGVALAARWILQKVVAWIASTEGSEFTEQRAFHYQVSLIKEGARAVAAACKMAAWEVTPPSMPYLEELVRAHNANTVGEIMKLRGGDVLITTSNPGDLVAEFLGAGISATRDGKQVKVSDLQLAPLLADYFGQSPCFSEVA